MKTNTIHIILAGVFAVVIGFAVTSKSGFDFSLLAAGVSYSAVAIIAAVAAVDYRRINKNHAAR